MLCLACCTFSSVALCRTCADQLAAAPVRRLPSGVLVWSAFHHSATARLLVARLKYQGMPAVARLLAVPMAALVPARVEALVPVPRSLARRWAYGVDGAALLAKEVGRITGVPVVNALAVPWWTPRSAGRRRQERVPPQFRPRRPLFTEMLLIDDVVTTGGTLEAAARACGARQALTATAGGWLTTL